MGGRLPSCSRTLWFLSRDWDTSRTIRSRIQRDVHATKTYSIILPSALISSRQLIERRDERKRNPFVSRACTYPYFSFSLSLSSFDPYSRSFRVSCQPISSLATISGCVKAIGSPSIFQVDNDFESVTFFRFFRHPIRFHFSWYQKRQAKCSPWIFDKLYLIFPVLLLFLLFLYFWTIDFHQSQRAN